MKKKEYIHPEMEVVEIKHQQQLLTGSLVITNGEFEPDDPILAPGMDVGPSIPGLPSFIFE